MLNIAPLDYERYAALYGPPQVLGFSRTEPALSQRAVVQTDPVDTRLGRRDLSYVVVPRPADVSNSRNTDMEPWLAASPALEENPIDLRTVLDLSNAVPVLTSAQQGVTPETVARAYTTQISKGGGEKIHSQASSWAEVPKARLVV